MGDLPENWLAADRSEVLQLVLESHGKTKKELQEYIEILKKWLSTQLHLPEIPDDNHIMNTVLVSKFSIEKCKQHLDMYYTIRNLFPEVYSSVNFREVMRLADSVYFIPLPKLTTEGSRVTVIKTMMLTPEDFDMHEIIGYCCTLVDMRLRKDIFTNEIFIDDLQNFKISFIPRITPIHLKKIILIIEKVYSNRVKQFHFVNCPPFFHKLIGLLKSMLKPKMAARIFTCEDSSKLREMLPLEILPKDYGGQERSLHELNESWKKNLAQYANRFDALAEMKANENLRTTPLVNDEVLGFHGNFRKLEMD